MCLPVTPRAAAPRRGDTFSKSMDRGARAATKPAINVIVNRVQACADDIALG